MYLETETKMMTASIPILITENRHTFDLPVDCRTYFPETSKFTFSFELVKSGLMKRENIDQ